MIDWKLFLLPHKNSKFQNNFSEKDEEEKIERNNPEVAHRNQFQNY